MSPSSTLQRHLFCQACRHAARSLQPKISTCHYLPAPQKVPVTRTSTRTLTTQRLRQPNLRPPQHHTPLLHYNTTPSQRFYSTSKPAPASRRTKFNTPPPTSASASAALKSKGRDRGPASAEETQTDFAALNVLGGATAPSTSIDICDFDGFALDSGLLVGEGDGVVLVSGEAFVWRPWMATAGVMDGSRRGRGSAGEKPKGSVVTGSMMRGRASESERTGGVLNASGQFEVSDEAWGLLRVLWPKPDLLIIGTGLTIRPLAPATRKYLQSLGMRVEILDTRNAASQFNMLATERGVGEVAAALVPLGFGAK